MRLMLRAVCVMEPEVPSPTPHHRNLYCTVRAPYRSLHICTFCLPMTLVTGWGEAHFGLRSSVSDAPTFRRGDVTEYLIYAKITAMPTYRF